MRLFAQGLRFAQTLRFTGGPWPALLLLLAGCGSTTPSRFYVLTPVETDSSEAAKPIHVRIAPIELPRYLGTLDMVTRNSGNRLELAEYDRWAEPLDGAFTRILVGNLARLVPTNHVVDAPWQGSSENEQVVHVSVERFDVQGDRAILEATWGVSSSMLTTGELQRSRIEEPTKAGDFASMAASLSRALGQLSEEIAQELGGPAPADQ